MTATRSYSRVKGLCSLPDDAILGNLWTGQKRCQLCTVSETQGSYSVTVQLHCASLNLNIWNKLLMSRDAFFQLENGASIVNIIFTCELRYCTLLFTVHGYITVCFSAGGATMPLKIEGSHSTVEHVHFSLIKDPRS